jgi:DNA invertase Pin-like site-specific DNA recombinase
MEEPFPARRSSDRCGWKPDIVSRAVSGVFTYRQTLDAQLEQLRAAGCSSRNIYREKVTGARADRRELLRMLGQLGPGNVVTVTRIDRLMRQGAL